MNQPREINVHWGVHQFRVNIIQDGDFELLYFVERMEGKGTHTHKNQNISWINLTRVLHITKKTDVYLYIHSMASEHHHFNRSYQVNHRKNCFSLVQILLVVAIVVAPCSLILDFCVVIISRHLVCCNRLYIYSIYIYT